MFIKVIVQIIDTEPNPVKITEGISLMQFSTQYPSPYREPASVASNAAGNIVKAILNLPTPPSQGGREITPNHLTNPSE